MGAAVINRNLNRSREKTMPATPETPQPTVTPQIADPKFGFNAYAERLNGRAAMLGFFLIVVIELLTDKGVLAWLGLR